MSGECEKCGWHTLECICKAFDESFKKPHEISVSQKDLSDLIFYARRYCDGRSTYAPSEFNKIYKRIRRNFPDFIRCKDKFDITLMDNGKYWPYAQDGQFDEKRELFDARK